MILQLKLNSVKTSWKLDETVHPGVGSLFLSQFVPDFAIGLRINTSDRNSPFHLNFLQTLPELLEPSIEALPNPGNPFSFPFLVWERRTDAQSSLFQAQNQLALPIIKALDILSGLGLLDLPVFGLVTLGYKWELYIGHRYVEKLPGCKVFTSFDSVSNLKLMQYNLKLLCEDSYGNFVGACRFLNTLHEIKNYAVENFQPRVKDALLGLK